MHVPLLISVCFVAGMIVADGDSNNDFLKAIFAFK